MYVRIGAYVDGMNLYYGGRRLCGRGRIGWRWLDPAALVERLISRNPDWVANGAALHRLVYCTARLPGDTDRRSRRDQETYLAALSTDDRIRIELGRFVMREVRGGDSEDRTVHRAIVIPEEKGSDVNVASHLLIDIHTRAIDAAVLVSNDSDLRLPAQHARTCVPTGTVNPRGGSTARYLRGEPGDGVGGHWWYRLTAEDFFGHQLPEVVGGALKPEGW